MVKIPRQGLGYPLAWCGTHSRLEWKDHFHGFHQLTAYLTALSLIFKHSEKLLLSKVLSKFNCISLFIRQFFSFQNNPKNLVPSYKMDLDLWDFFGRIKLIVKFHRTDSVICSHSREEKPTSYILINTV